MISCIVHYVNHKPDVMVTDLLGVRCVGLEFVIDIILVSRRLSK